MIVGSRTSVPLPSTKSGKKCTTALNPFGPLLLFGWPVLAEAPWLLRNEASGMNAIGGLITSHLARLAALDETALAGIIAFPSRQASARPQMADAA